MRSVEGLWTSQQFRLIFSKIPCRLAAYTETIIECFSISTVHFPSIYHTGQPLIIRLFTLHRFNLKLRVAGLKRVSEEDFVQIESSTVESESQKSKKSNAKSDNQQSSSSSSAVAEPTEEDSSSMVTSQADIELEISTVVRTGSAKVSFYAKNKTEAEGFTKLSIWKSVLLPKSKENDSLSYLNALKESPKKQQWFAALETPTLPYQNLTVLFFLFRTILMCTGGYFAGAVFRNKEVLQHKRIARYTVRRKQGGAQASKDASDPSRTPQSAGAYIRRQNEKKLKEEIAELLKNWKPLIDQSELIFLFAPSYNRFVPLQLRTLSFLDCKLK
jgi:hypothetical protein